MTIAYLVCIHSVWYQYSPDMFPHWGKVKWDTWWEEMSLLSQSHWSPGWTPGVYCHQIHQVTHLHHHHIHQRDRCRPLPHQAAGNTSYPCHFSLYQCYQSQHHHWLHPVHMVDRWIFYWSWCQQSLICHPQYSHWVHHIFWTCKTKCPCESFQASR